MASFSLTRKHMDTSLESINLDNLDGDAIRLLARGYISADRLITSKPTYNPPPPDLPPLASHEVVGLPPELMQPTPDVGLPQLDRMSMHRTHSNVALDISGCGVYVIHREDKNLYKIGFSCELPTRIKTICKSIQATTTVVHVLKTQNYVALERCLHRHFAAWRVHGEWFALTPADLEWLAALDPIAFLKGPTE